MRRVRTISRKTDAGHRFGVVYKMPTLNFTARFADAVESGEKRQTICKLGKRQWKVGDVAYLHVGQRLEHGDSRKRFLGKAIVTSVHRFLIDAQ